MRRPGHPLAFLSCALACLVTLALFMPSAAVAQAPAPSFEQIARSGDRVPGREALNVVFKGRTWQYDYYDMPGVFSHPSINNAGEVIFRGESSAPSDFNLNHALGLYYRLPGQPLKVLVDDTLESGVPKFVVPGHIEGTRFTDFRPPLLNNAGDVLFKAYFTVPGLSGAQSGFFACNLHTEPAPVFVRLVDTVLDDIPGYPGTTFNRGFGYGSTFLTTMPAALNDAGQVIFQGDFQLSTKQYQDSGIFATTVAGGPIVRLVDSAESMSPIDDASRVFASLSETPQPVLNNNGDVIFRAMINIGYGSGYYGLFTVPVSGATRPRTLARQSTAAPALSDNVTRYYTQAFGAFDLADSGRFVFQHSFSGSPTHFALFYGTLAAGVQGVLFDSAGGHSLPGMPGAAIDSLGTPLINEAGTVVFYAHSSVNNTGGHYVKAISGGPVQTVAQTATLPPGRSGDVRFTDFETRSPTINEQGNIALMPRSYDYTNSRTGYGAWLYSDCAGLGRIVDESTSDPLPPEGLGGSLSNTCSSPCIRMVRLYQGNDVRAGGYRALNESNQVGLVVGFNAGDAAVYVATCPLSGGEPEITCPPDVELECPADTEPAATGVATAVDGCSGNALTPTYTDGIEPGCGGAYVIRRTWTVTNEAEESASCVQVITVQDTMAPVLAAPEDVTIDCDAATDPSATGTATVIDACDSLAAASFVDAVEAGVCPAEQVITRTWTATDACGNTTTAVQTITVTDTAAPVVTPPADVVLACGESTEPAETGTATATDGCDAAPALTYADEEAAGACPQERVITRTWTATDACDNTATAVQTITVRDIVAPVLAVPPPATVECGGETDPASTGAATATDNCDGDPQVDYADAVAPGACPGEQIITRTWTATDACGNKISGAQTIHVIDTTAPVLEVPADATLECGAATTPADTGAATASDTCDAAPIITYTDTFTDGTCPAVQIITRLWTATDACGNRTSATQVLTLIDSEPPVLQVPADATLDCAAAFDPAAAGEATATDACGGNVVLTWADALASGSCLHNTVVTRTWTATDGCGNSATGVQTIQLTDATPPALQVPADVQLSCHDGIDPAQTGTALALDTCDPAPLVTFADAIVGDGCPTIVTRTWLAVDACGNTATGVQTLTIDDDLPPAFLVPPQNLELACDGGGNALELEAWLASVSATDACGQVTVTHDFHGLPGGCNGTGAATVTWTATDTCGNSASASAVFTITDNTPPVFTAPPQNVTVECDGNGNQAELLAWLVAPAAADTCGNVTITNDFVDSGTGCGLTGVTNVTWTATDDCGNSVQATAAFTIVDTLPPLLTPPADIVFELQGGECSVSGLDLGAAIAVDTCGGVTITNNAPEVFEAGETVVTWTATDECGHSVSAEQLVVVSDERPPFIHVWLDEYVLWPPNNKFVNVGLDVCIRENCAGSVTTTVQVYSDEDDQEVCDNAVHSPDAKNIAADTLRLRAERRGNSNGRVYLIVVTATDASGNSTSRCTEVLVPHDRSAGSLATALLQAALAHCYFEHHNAPPPGYHLIGDGPVIGTPQ